MIERNIPPASESGETSLLCVRCGYDLRGQAPEGFCPECGMSVQQSQAVGTHLQRGRPEWLKRLCLGTWVLMLVPVLVIVVPNVVPAIYGDVPRWVTAAIPIGLAVIQAAGLILLTSREHRYEKRLAGNFLRVALRTCALAPMIIAGCVELVLANDGRSERLAILLVASLLLLIPTYVFTFVYLRTLAQRIEHPSLAEHCIIVAVGISLSIVLPMLLGLTGAESIWFIMPTVVLIFLFLLWSSYLLFRFAIKFGKAAKASRQEWIAADAAHSL